MMPTRPVLAEISRSRLSANWKLLRAAAPAEAELVAVIKANAYGHGATACAPVLAAAGAKWFGVTCVEEAVALRQVSPASRILVMSGLWRGEAEAVIEHQLSPQVWEPLHFDLLEEAARKLKSPPQSVRIQLEIDSGMSRQGVRSLDQLKELLTRITLDSPIQIEGVMTHFSAPEILQPNETAQQLKRFEAALEVIAECGIRPRYIHGGNSTTLLAQHHSPALLQLAKKHGARLMLRPGIALYGYPVPLPPEGTGRLEMQQLAPVLAWKTRVISARTIEPGETAGYNMTFKAQRPTRLALVPVGYADGLNRLLSNRGHALVRGQRAPIAGRVSMDQTILDVTDVAGVEIGDEVVLIGELGNEKITATDLANITGTIAYEVLCAIGARVPRVMID